MDAPTADELSADPVVQAAFAAAWADSFAEDTTLCHEEGGYIYFDPATRRVSVRRTRPGERRSIDLSNPPEVVGNFLVATYHTHPHSSSLNWQPDPSLQDRLAAADSGVPWFVVAEQQVYACGPTRRVGGLTGPPGYPI